MQHVGMHVVANWTQGRSWSLDRFERRNGLALLLGLFDPSRLLFLLLGFPSQRAFHGFSGLCAGLNEQVRDKPRIQGFGFKVSRMMQRNTVLLLVFPSVAANMIECLSERLKRPMKGLCLFWRRIELYPYRSVHTESRPYMSRSCKF